MPAESYVAVREGGVTASLAWTKSVARDVVLACLASHLLVAYMSMIVAGGESWPANRYFLTSHYRTY